MSKPETFTLTAKTDKKGRLYVVDDLGRVLSQARSISLNCSASEPVQLNIGVLVKDIELSSGSITCVTSGLGRVDSLEIDKSDENV